MSLIVTTVVTISSTGKKHSAANVMRIIFAHGSMIVQLQIIMRNTHTHKNIQSGVRVLYLVSECHTKVTRVWYTLKQSC